MGRVVIAGGGIAALEAALVLQDMAPELADVEILAPDDEFVYRPLAVAEPFLAGEARRFPLEPLVEGAGARLRRTRVTALDPGARLVLTEEGTVPYDAVLLALGARPRGAGPRPPPLPRPPDTP